MYKFTLEAVMNKDGVFVANDITISNMEKLSEKQSIYSTYTNAR